MNDLVIPATPAAAAALEVAAAYQSPALQSHSRRVYVWATALAERENIQYDAELLFVAAMFHDLSLVPVFDSHTVSFEEAAGHLARVFATGAGWSPVRRERLGEVIVRHMWPDVSVSDDPAGHLISRAAALDIVGKNVDELSTEFRADVLKQFPRLGLTDEFLKCFQAQAERKPDSSPARAIKADLSTRIAANPLDA
ncbi:HD domain-containing protein [Kribbella antibiotica]|uniref:HD domain-containing protein n=1 Tax=Kribbella antibiotica TaxID=190195 RepID=A0A4R4ZVI2_9ACTN|nr:HD domain-containing protein [Kribbella antibiotica]TDD62214.1 HD domain-containing protein [Kribbella antibiotica]